MSILVKVAVACCLASVCAKQELFAGDQINGINQELETFFKVEKDGGKLKIKNIGELVETIKKMKEGGPIRIFFCRGKDRYYRMKNIFGYRDNCIFIDESYWGGEHYMDPHFCYIQSEAKEFIDYVLHSKEAQDLRESLRGSANYILDDCSGLSLEPVPNMFAPSFFLDPVLKKMMEENPISYLDYTEKLRKLNKRKVSDICTFLNETLIRGGALRISECDRFTFEDSGFNLDDLFDRDEINIDVYSMLMSLMP